MEATIKVQLKQAVKTESQWRSSNPVIPDGCMAITSDRGNATKLEMDRQSGTIYHIILQLHKMYIRGRNKKGSQAIQNLKLVLVMLIIKAVNKSELN